MSRQTATCNVDEHEFVESRACTVQDDMVCKVNLFAGMISIIHHARNRLPTTTLYLGIGLGCEFGLLDQSRRSISTGHVYFDQSKLVGFVEFRVV